MMGYNDVIWFRTFCRPSMPSIHLELFWLSKWMDRVIGIRKTSFALTVMKFGSFGFVSYRRTLLSHSGIWFVVMNYPIKCRSACKLKSSAPNKWDKMTIVCDVWNPFVIWSQFRFSFFVSYLGLVLPGFVHLWERTHSHPPIRILGRITGVRPSWQSRAHPVETNVHRLVK